MRVLLVDNDDSYTHNLAQLVAVVTGERPVVVRNDARDWERHHADAIVLSPGPGHPAEPADIGICADVVRRATVPVLGVCLGHQVLALAYGASVTRAEPIVHGGASEIRHDGHGVFAGLPDGFTAIRYHSWTVDPASVRDPIEVTARTPDGVVMALRHRERPLYGVQFHPESVSTEHGALLVANFLGRPAVSLRPPVREPAPTVATAAAPVAVPWREPEDVFLALERDSPDIAWLDGAGGGRFSYVGVPSQVEALRAGDGVLDRLATIGASVGRGDAAAPFGLAAGGWVVVLGYGVKAECGLPERDRPPYADALLLRLDALLAWDHVTGEAWSVGGVVVPEVTAAGPPPSLAAAAPAYDAALPPDAYRAAVVACQERLRAGDSYEVNLTTQLTMRDPIDAVTAYRVLRRANPAPYAGFVRAGGVSLLSSSPERFLRIDARGGVETKPIKGTAPRLADSVRDRAAADALRSDPKSRAENLMVADLLRNDLGVVCKPGTVHVPALMAVESYATVHQLVTTVRGTLRADAGFADVVRAVFPPGSMTGAPKPRTASIIDALEPTPRGFYSGAFGYVGDSGAVDLAVTIRTAVVRDGVATVGAGGGVVLASDPAAEHAEAMLKADVVLRALAAARR